MLDRLDARSYAAAVASDRFAFWQRWLFWASVATGGLGVSLAFFDTQLVPGFPEAVNQALWRTPTMPAEVVTYHRFTHAVLGATILSWAITMAFLAHHPFRKREPWAWWCMTASLLGWFALDTSMSLYFGVWPNAVFNLVALVFLGTPLVFTRSAFATAG